MKASNLILVLFFIALVIWPSAVIGIIFIFCVLGVIALEIDKSRKKS
jgi:hypothetical protein